MEPITLTIAALAAKLKAAGVSAHEAARMTGLLLDAEDKHNEEEGKTDGTRTD